MEFSARKRNIRVSPRKLRPIVDIARRQNVQVALDRLRFDRKRTAKVVFEVIQSALNNAAQSRGVNVDELVVGQIYVDKGPTIKRFMPRARGGASRILKRTSHMTVILSDGN